MSTPEHDLSKLKLDRSVPVAKAMGFRWRSFAIAAVLLVVALIIIQLSFAKEFEVRAVTATPIDATSGAVSAGEAAVTANGYVVARTRAAVAAKIPGRLIALEVSEGSYVRAGAVIARLESADYAADVEEARANLATVQAQRIEAESERDQALRDAERLKRIAAGRAGLTAEQELEVAASRAAQATARAGAAAGRVDAALASLKRSEATLESTVIRAPFTGTVLRKEAELGEVVAPSVGGGLTRGAVVTMADLSTLEVEVDVNEAYIGRVRHGQRTRIVLDAYPDTGFRGTVRQVVPTADRQRATVQVKVGITDHDARILPEMGARVDFLAAEPSARAANAASAAPVVSGPPRFRLPSDAVKTVGGATVVWLIRDGKLESREVDAGPVSAGFREIRRGLVGGEQVMISGVETPAAGMRVKVSTP